MKKLFIMLLMLLIGESAFSAPQQHKKQLILTYDRCEEILMESPRNDVSLSLWEKIESLIKDGEYPVVIEYDHDIAWILLNDPDNSRDYPEAHFKSDYFETITDLFPIKINKTLKNSLIKGNKVFFETLGIEYIIEDEEVISKINYDKFERFVH